MKYFVRNSEKVGTCYHEFYKGHWDEETFWKEDSLLLHDDVLYENKGFVAAIIKVIPTYDLYGETEISIDEWRRIGQVISKEDSSSYKLYYEASEWLSNEVFTEYDCFTILGI